MVSFFGHPPAPRRTFWLDSEPLDEEAPECTPLPAFRDCPGRNRRFGLLSALRAHTNAPHKTNFLRETLRPRNRPWAARTVWPVAERTCVLGPRFGARAFINRCDGIGVREKNSKTVRIIHM
jgi:hypothetical protein